MKKKGSVLPLLYLLTALIFSPLYGQKIQYPDESPHQITFPIEIVDNVVYLTVQINDQFIARFVLDTGADGVSAVSSTFADEMGVLDRERESHSGNALRKAKISRLYGTRIKIAGAVFSDFDFITLPLNRLEPYWGRRIDGLLGGNILKELVLTVDYEKSKITLADRLDAQAKTSDYKLPLTVMGTTPMVEAQVLRFGDKPPVTGRFIVDTAVRLSFFNTPFTKAHDLLGQSPRVIENITGYGIGGAIFEKVGRVAQVSLGGARLLKPIFQLSTCPDGFYGTSLFDGIIGADLLSRFTVVFDFPGRMLYLRPNKWFSNPFVYDMSGISFTMEDEGRAPVSIVHVVAKSPADGAGVQKGDVLLDVDGRNIDTFSMSQLKEYFRQKGRQVSLKLKRQGKVVTASFVLNAYI